jgi:superfamily II DNA/RNA helicase
MSSDDYDELLENNNYVTLNETECNIKILALSIMIIKTMKDLNIKHMLIFSNKNEKAKKIMETIETLLENEELNIYCKYLNGTDKMNKRRYEVKLFEHSEIGIISSAKLFGEGVNIPICDSVCFADNKSSTVDIIQYVGRCLRKCKDVPNKLSHVIVPFIMDNDTDNFFDSENKSFFKLRRILKSLGTTDELISEKFVLKDCSKCACGKNDDVKESLQTVNVRQIIDLKHFEQSIISKIFDRDGNSESRIRNKIIHENKRRYVNGLKLIDTKDKCLKFLEEESETDIPEPTNWIKYCLGNDLFLEIKKKYYYSKEDLISACNKIKIVDFETYKKQYKKDPKIPTPDYINDGFYLDLDKKFNITLLLINNSYEEDY